MYIELTLKTKRCESKYTKDWIYFVLQENERIVPSYHALQSRKYTGSVSFECLTRRAITIDFKDGIIEAIHHCNLRVTSWTKKQKGFLIIKHYKNYYIFQVKTSIKPVKYYPITISKTGYLSKEALLRIEPNLALSLLSPNNFIRESAERCI